LREKVERERLEGEMWERKVGGGEKCEG